MKYIHRGLLSSVLAAALLTPGVPACAAPPATLSITIGSALLCQDQLNSKYFYDYLFIAFGKPYKAERGAYWFSTSRDRRSGSNIWGLQVSDILVNDSNSPADFIGAVFNATPQALADAITHNTGFRFNVANTTQKYALLQSQTGSVIAYAGTQAKIYCAKSKYLVPSLPN